ncbi:hypothetical protein MTR67_019254 [Solanum verrucosum]|uniref:DUF7903 domain-containing protein n=1 Tax=Solanum verrucosum TaxID=315347 RepID=A0AAF0TNE7_SOLVR|nr:hypothetical protein MTR67_019254 [Solanum verrucosum]
MAYIPPHKRQTKGFPLLNPTLAPDFLTPNNFTKSVNLKSFGEQNNFRGKTIVYRKFAVSKWFSIGLADYSRFSSLVSLQPFSADYFDGNPDRKALSLVLMEGCSEGITNELIDTPWLLIATNGDKGLKSTPTLKDLLLSFQHMKHEMEEADMAQVKPSVVARFGKILFHGNSSICEESQETTPLSEANLSDRLRPNSSVTCKCTVAKDYNKIELYKNEQINGIKDLIGSAVLDSEVQGGLRVEMAHWQGFFRFKLRHADPFEFKSSTGEVTQEIFLKMPGIISELRKQTMDEDLVFEMLENNLKLIWDLCLLDGSSN